MLSFLSAAKLLLKLPPFFEKFRFPVFLFLLGGLLTLDFVNFPKNRFYLFSSYFYFYSFLSYFHMNSIPSFFFCSYLFYLKACISNLASSRISLTRDWYSLWALTESSIWERIEFAYLPIIFSCYFNYFWYAVSG